MLINVVLCGHSLGGGYAILRGLELLHMGVDQHAIVMHGALQVIKPDFNSELWGRLNEVTTLYVNGFDVVPRLPSCNEEWKETLVGLVPSLTREKSYGAFELHIDELLENMGVWKTFQQMGDFRHVGKLVFATTDETRRKRMMVDANGPGGDDEGWKLLTIRTECSGGFIIKHHKEYPEVLNSFLTEVERMQIDDFDSTQCWKW